jgi:hypothetical protein
LDSHPDVIILPSNPNPLPNLYGPSSLFRGLCDFGRIS